jgi:hypothetical protein
MHHKALHHKIRARAMRDAQVEITARRAIGTAAALIDELIWRD